MQDRFRFRTYHKPTKIMEYNGQWSGKDYDRKFNDCDFVVMQSTGLRDKNGNLIYEGDCVKLNAGFIGYIGFKKCVFRIIVPNRYSANIDDDFECEVIGNIYENKEMLK